MVKVLGWSDDDQMCSESRAKVASFGDLFSVDRSGLPDQDPSTIAAALAAAVKENGIDFVMIGASKLGKDVAPRLAGLLDWPYAAEVQELDHADGGWTVKRMVLSGNSMATYSMGPNAVCTTTPGTFETTEDPHGTEIKLAADGPSTVTVTGTKGEEHSDFDLGSADVVIGVGRGFKDKGDIKLAEDLAAKFKGGAVGCSRPIAADLKWLGEEHWIGLSGHEIRPKAYIAAGVSGQIQHVAGIRGSKLIIAINTNKDAPIFQVADYGIVGDLYKILPQLTQKL